MNINFFLYRRLCQWITCQLKLSEKSIVTLKNKYEVASFQDVFCHPFYWQIFNWIEKPPQLVVDCGAHCGHFSILADLCFQSKFNDTNTEYLLVEPNPFLISTIQKNVLQSNLERRTKIIQGLLGSESDEGTLWIPPKNYLQSSLNKIHDAKPHKIKYVDLTKIVQDKTIDVLKIDIEGGEFEFIKSHLQLFNQVNLLFMELHQATEQIHQTLFDSLSSVGLNVVTKPLEANGQQLIIFQRKIA